jgi:anti-sigma factor RsiW
MSLDPSSFVRPYITCRQLLDFIYDYLDGALPDEQRAEFERHLSVCPSCVHYLDTYKQTLRISQQALQPSGEFDDCLDAVPEPLVRSILAALGSRSQQIPRR